MSRNLPAEVEIITLALADKIAVLTSGSYLEARAARGIAEKYHPVLGKSPSANLTPKIDWMDEQEACYMGCGCNYSTINRDVEHFASSPKNLFQLCEKHSVVI